jgi:mono/diheme cytochrome c family protein
MAFRVREPMTMMPLFVILALICLPSVTLADSPDPQRGKEFAQANCAQCHSIERTGSSPRYPAPPFRELHTRYPVEALEESLAEGIVTGHADMPEFQLSPDQIDDLIAFLKTLE